MICAICEQAFDPKPDHRGKVNVCLSCGGEDVEPLRAEVSWEGKQTPLIHVTTKHRADLFNRANRRHGLGVLSSIVTPRETNIGREAAKTGSGAEPGASYTSKLGERHQVKL